MQENREQGTETFVIEGRNAILEAFRSGRTIDKIYVLDGCQDGPVRTIVREAKKHVHQAGILSGLISPLPGLCQKSRLLFL